MSNLGAKTISWEPFKECIKPAPPLPVMTVRLPVIVPLSPLELMYFFQSTSSSSFPKYAAEWPSGYTAVSEPPVQQKATLLINQATLEASTSMDCTNNLFPFYPFNFKSTSWYKIFFPNQSSSKCHKQEQQRQLNFTGSQNYTCMGKLQSSEYRERDII